MIRGGVHFLGRGTPVPCGFRSAVSLHSHTSCSRETLGSVPGYADRNAALRWFLSPIVRKYRLAAGRELDFARAYFIPPLSAAGAYAAEAGQIRALGLRPLVSITDHDTIQAPLQLRKLFDSSDVAISLEWTVPFGPAHFHVGVHNIPGSDAAEIAQGLIETRCSYCRIREIACGGTHDLRCMLDPSEWFERLSSLPDTLLVLNHPLWDTCGLGQAAHEDLLVKFLDRHRRQIHALELNGLRAWAENRRAADLAAVYALPVISGGDRHGREPNAVLNLTNAESFAEFAREIRKDKYSILAFMSQYRIPLQLRKLQIAADVLRKSDSASEGTVRWTDRICLPWIDGRVLPLSSPEWTATDSVTRGSGYPDSGSEAAGET